MDAITNWPDGDSRVVRPYFNAVLDKRVTMTSEEINEPVTLAEAKTWLKIDGTYNDDILNLLIPMCRMQLEMELGLSLISKLISVDIRYEVGDSGYILPYGPATGNITALDIDGNTIDPENYEIKTMGADLALMTHHSFITLTYEAGFESIPLEIKLRLLKLIEREFYERGGKK